MEKSQIISEIDSRVNSAKSKDYSIGVTDNPSERKSQHGDPQYWKQWTTNS